jgi:putative transposase
MQYKQESLAFIDRQVSLGRKLSEVLTNLEVPKSTYFSWKKQAARISGETKPTKPHPMKLTPTERELILKTKYEYMDRRHRQIQGILQNRGVYISATTVFKVLKKAGLVEEYERRESPWKKRRYEVAKRNLKWGTDWTKIKIAHQSWHLITLIDFFSRRIIAWKIVPEANSGHIKAIYQEGLLTEGLTNARTKPRLRADLGAPNTSRATREFMMALTQELPSYARVRRPTDNAITERFYGTIKQEEIYLVGNYPDLISAEAEIGHYIDYYNRERPHQALWNFIPEYVHQVNNKSLILAELEALKFKAKTNRREYWALAEMVDFQKNLITRLQSDLAQTQDSANMSISSIIENA